MLELWLLFQKHRSKKEAPLKKRENHFCSGFVIDVSGDLPGTPDIIGDPIS